jgi:hypothetical protein
MTNRRLPVKLMRHEAMWVTRVALHHSKLVYVIVADSMLKYPNGRSRVAYVGTTQNGVSRMAESAAFRTDQVLGLRGVNTFHVRVITCRAVQHVKTWTKLERALLLTFREEYGSVPYCNSHGKGMAWKDELDYFSYPRLVRLLDEIR